MKKLLIYVSKKNINAIFPNSNKRFYAKETSSGENVAIILSGCGYLDGTEITEAVSLIIHLTEKKFNIQFFAPNTQQEETVDHIKKTVEKNEIRNILEESARITRTNVFPLNRLKADNFACLFIPGGYGIGKNLSNFSSIDEMNDFKINDQVVSILQEFHGQKKPIGLICLAPILAAKVFQGCQITLGDEISLKNKVEKLGSNLIIAGPEDIVIDKKNRLISTPAYCHSNSKPNQVYKAIGDLVEATVNFSGSDSGFDKRDAELYSKVFGRLSPEKQKSLKADLEKDTKNTKYSRDGQKDEKKY